MKPPSVLPDSVVSVHCPYVPASTACITA